MGHNSGIQHVQKSSMHFIPFLLVLQLDSYISLAFRHAQPLAFWAGFVLRMLQPSCKGTSFSGNGRSGGPLVAGDHLFRDTYVPLLTRSLGEMPVRGRTVTPNGHEYQYECIFSKSLQVECSICLCVLDNPIWCVRVI